VICADGSPEVIHASNFDIPGQYKNAAPEKLDSDAQIKAGEVLSSLTTVKASAPELDTLESLRLAVRSFASAPANSKRVIIVFDTGLSTTGLLDFRNHILDAKPSVVAGMLAQKQAIPDFSNTVVLWQQCGDVGAPQKKLSPDQVIQLKNIWSAIIKKGGGSSVFSRILPSPGDIPANQYPHISTVSIEPETSISFNPQKPTVFSEEEIRFIGNTAVYVDPLAASRCLTPAAEYFKDNPYFQGLLAGTTAGAIDKNFCKRLSLARANAVRDTLISLGVSPNQLFTVGLADTDPWHIPDRNKDGTLIEKIAKQNRKVVLLDASSDIALSIINR